MSKKTSIRIRKELEEILFMSIKKWTTKNTKHMSTAIFEAFMRLETQYKIDRQRLKDFFTDDEWKLMFENALTTHYGYATILGVVLADTEDTEKAIFELHHVDRGKLINKLRQLNTGEQFALVDWLEEMRESL